mgnify:CR=1 FL=1
MKKNKIKWIEFYTQAPADAVYIVRLMDDFTVRFEKYNGLHSSIVLKDFPYESLSEEKCMETLAECRRIIGSEGDTIWAEMPSWKYFELHPDIW